MWFIFQNLGKPVFLSENILDAIQVEHGMASNVRCLVEAFVSCASSPNSGHNYYVFTVTADESQYSGPEGTLTVSLLANVIEGGNQAAQHEFSVAPRDLTVTLAGPPQQTVTGDFNVDIEFNLSVQTQSGNLEGDPLWHFRIDDVTVDRGEVRSISGADTTWSTEIRPPDSYEGDLTVQILAGAVRAEEHTNGNEASEVLSVRVDTLEPTVTITARETVVRKSTFTVTFTFSEPVTGFTEDDIGVAGGTLVAGSLTGTEADPVWTVRVTAAETPDNDQVGISLPPDTVTDEAGNLNSALEELFVTVVHQPASNASPTFISDSTTLEVAENSPAGTNVGDPVTATDDDNDTLTYTPEGTDAAVSRVDDRSDLWEVRLTPESDAMVTVSLSQAADCDAAGAVCTEDGRMLSVGVARVILGPPPNSPATGQPSISGTARVGETLTVDTAAIADVDGLETATFSYQWMADDANIQGATGLAATR